MALAEKARKSPANPVGIPAGGPAQSPAEDPVGKPQGMPPVHVRGLGLGLP